MKYNELKTSAVRFDEAHHEYTTPEGQILSGVTSVLKAVIYHSKYSDIPEHILEAAAQRGTFIHNACQQTDLFDVVDEERLIPEARNYMHLKRKNSIKIINNEYLVSDGAELATMIDCIDNAGNLYDIKTTRELDTEYLSWQLSLCAYLFEHQNPTLRAGKLYGIWLRGETAELVEVERKSMAEIESLLHDWRMGIARPAPQTTEIMEGESREMRMLHDYEQDIVLFKSYIERLEEDKKSILQGIKARMEAEGIKKLESPRLLVTLVADSTSKSFDSTRFKKDHPELAEQYQKETQRKGYVKITLRQ